MPRSIRYRFSLFVLLNVAFALLLGLAYAAGGLPNPRLFFLVLLFGLCSTSVIDLDGLNGRYALLALFMLVYFVSFGVRDLSQLFTGTNVSSSSLLQPTPDFLSKAEAIILVGGTMLVLGYRMAVAMANANRSTRSPRDWSKATILTIGLIFWVVGTIATYRWHFYIVTDTTNEAYRKGLASVSPATVTAYLVGQMCQPLGVLLLAYAYAVFRNLYLVALVVAIVALQVFIGFVVDVKGLAMLGMILVIMTSVLVDGRFPKAWLAVGIMFVTLVYPYFTAYRTAIHGGGIARTAVVQNFGMILQKTVAAKDKVNSGRDRAQSFLERSNVKNSVEIIVARTGNGVAFQQGHTLSPIVATFIPKILWSDKLRVPTGQLFNKEFRITDGDDIYISPSHLGELYWNFGWPGVLLGMAVIGALCGWVGASFNLAEFRTVTRVLVTVITVKQLIVGFEGGIADIYVVWLRSIAGIGILHLVFARVPVTSRLFQPAISSPRALSIERFRSQRLFPNLLT